MTQSHTMNQTSYIPGDSKSSATKRKSSSVE